MAQVHKQRVPEAAAALRKYLALAPEDTRAWEILEQLEAVLRSDSLQAEP